MESPIVRLRARWLARDIELTSGISDEEIAAEELYGVAFPPDVRDYLRLINGMSDRGWDEEMICFCPLEEIVPVALEYSDRRIYKSFGDGPEMKPYFIFAGYLISSHSHAVALRPESDGTYPVIWLHGNECYRVAPSFTAFIEFYLKDINSILFPKKLL